MKKLLVALSIIGISTAVMAQPFGGGRGHGGSFSHMGGKHFGLLEKHPEIAEEAGVTDEQMDQFREVRYEQQKKMVKLRADLELAELEMRKLMGNDETDREAVFAAVDEVSAARTAIQKARIEQMWEAHEILGEETIETLRDLAREKRRERAGKQGRRRSDRGQRRGGHNRGERWDRGPAAWDDEAPGDEDEIDD